MDQEQVIAKLQTIFDQLFLESPAVTAALTANEVPEWDSLMHISLLVAVESEFKIRFSVGEVESTKNVGDFANLIARRANA